MYGKIQITGTMEIITGIHIGGSSAFAAIGAVDSPVVRDTATNDPMIPGSSLKGKMRYLLAKKYAEGILRNPDDDDEKIIRLFGTAKKIDKKIPRGHVLISDMVLSNKKDLQAKGIIDPTEVKFENTISRLTAVANPRQIERVIRGAEFKLDIIYEADDESKIEEDMSILKEGFKLLEYDYLGGSGSRGYGKVKFRELHADAVIGDIDEGIMEKVNELLAG